MSAGTALLNCSLAGFNNGMFEVSLPFWNDIFLQSLKCFFILTLHELIIKRHYQLEIKRLCSFLASIIKIILGWLLPCLGIMVPLGFILWLIGNTHLSPGRSETKRLGGLLRRSNLGIYWVQEIRLDLLNLDISRSYQYSRSQWHVWNLPSWSEVQSKNLIHCLDPENISPSYSVGSLAFIL